MDAASTAARTAERESVVLLLVPAADPVVGSWRQRLDPSASQGIPSHVTLLYPFLPAESIGFKEITKLREFFFGMEGFELTLSEFGRFPGVLYLKPEPDKALRAVIRALGSVYPDLPPYGRNFEEPTPHLTLAQTEDEPTLADVEREVGTGLPIVSRIQEAALMLETVSGWEVRERFSLGPAAKGRSDTPRA